MTDIPALHFSNNVAEHRYEARHGDTLAAYVEYSQLANGVLFSHTEVLPEYEGRGVGSAIARHVLDSARADGQFVIPACQFIAGYIRKHREYVDLVQPQVQQAFKI
ncbi:GNAT family N-acetyltransferase [Xenophilus arseniciresistens]|uniref:GNAT family N-acetyltransferase n=1 Tax=Xenophilus arseniciresistens TaxID=1283306 RepID=A0AAE3NC66_9BURK|nr:GNAT family N-acetyltransferase [Xenophilus arseniciresistens]MDA7418718.1 GNAT family N-acetyltransferase [Xenophilus arseniciresistens]